ncbi:MAG TPA: class I SAM-dependent methyltransferase [Alphaproteobacteria bacterium]|nr:class I SAM-dependent methyltransferase [Alphaproteobacteria bacterium]
MILRDRILAQLRRRLADAELPLRLRFWDGVEFDFARAPSVTITLNKPAVLRQFLLGDIDRLGRSYVEGNIEVDGRLSDILAVGIALAERAGRSSTLSRLPRALAWLGRARKHSRSYDAAAISYHYDVSNEFYQLWLDRSMTYSCAYFRTGDEDIDTAQEQKLDHICAKLRLRDGERLLDIGCGWGGLLVRAARRYGISGVGVTLSERQYAFARERIAAEGLADRLEIRLQDYRDIPGEAAFDKVVSVGMYEHVGRRNLPLYFAAIARLLKPGGVLLNHGITTGNRDGEGQGVRSSFIERYVFPGGELPHISRVLYEMAGGGLEPLDVENLRPHYALTLLHWVRRLESRKARAIELAGPERYRIWRIYMAGCAYAFERGWLSIHQVLAVKPGRAGDAPRPWTRAHLYVPDDPAKLAAPPTWEGV